MYRRFYGGLAAEIEHGESGYDFYDHPAHDCTLQATTPANTYHTNVGSGAFARVFVRLI